MKLRSDPAEQGFNVRVGGVIPSEKIGMQLRVRKLQKCLKPNLIVNR